MNRLRAGLTGPAREHRSRKFLISALAGLLLVASFFAIPIVRFDTPLSTVLVDRHGALLGATIADDEQWRFPPQRQVPQKFATAVVTFEDKRFAWHPGVDPLALARAMWLNLRHGQIRSGASTLTMQTVRLARQSPPRTVGQKLIEMLLALRLEAAHSKGEILALYSSNAPFGGNTVGLEAAAWRYFGRQAAELSWAEAATLAVLPNSPALIHPGRNRDALRNKRDRLLEKLAETGALPQDDLALAKAEPLPQAPLPIPQIAPHLLMNARAANERHCDTTLDQTLQRRANAIVERHAKQLEGNGVHNAAVLIVEVQTGQVAAYVGNTGGLRRSDHHNHVDIVKAQRSTGSTLKPFLYGVMVQRGELMPTQLVPDVPTHIAGFSPENFDRRHYGALPAHQALARSRNVPAVWMLRKYGVDRFQGQLTRMGMSTLHRDPALYGLTLILGGSEATLWELTSLYRNLAWSATHPDGGAPPQMSWQPTDETSEHQLLDPGAAYLTLDALLKVNRPGVESAWEVFDSSQPIAWKTGTSFGFRDAWALGVTPRYAIGVWVGNADGEGRPNLTGLTSAAPILFDLFDLADNENTWFAAPYARLDTIDVCVHSGYPAGPNCSQTVAQQVPRTASAARPCPYCERIHLDPDGKHRVDASCESLENMKHTTWFTLPPDMAWFYARRNPGYRAMPPIREDCSSHTSRNFTLLYPAPGSEMFVPIELDGNKGRVVFEAVHQDRDSALYWHIDEEFVGTTKHLHQLALAPTPGEHLLTLVDSKGTRMVRPFTVLD